MKYPLLKTICIAGLLTISSPLAHAMTNEEAKPTNKSASMSETKPDHTFTTEERDLIQDYYYRHRYDSGRTVIPKSIQKKPQRTGKLPPDWQKSIQRGKVLPIDIYEHGREIPAELQESLPKGPADSKIIKLEGKVIRVVQSTRVILDVLNISDYD